MTGRAISTTNAIPSKNPVCSAKSAAAGLAIPLEQVDKVGATT